MNNKLIVVLILLIFILTISISVGGYFIYSNMQHNTNTTEKIIEEVPEETEMISFEFKDGIYNIVNSKGKEKLLKLSFTLKLTGKKEELPKLEEFKSEMEDVIINIISGTDADTLMKLEGKNLLKDELNKDLSFLFTNENISLKINKILITSCIVK